MRARLATGLALLSALALGVAAPAGAASIQIDYDLSGTTFDVTDPIALAIPADQISGSLSLEFATDAFGAILLGPSSSVTLLSFDVVMDLALNVMGFVDITTPTPVATSLAAPVAGGTVAADGTISFAGTPDATLDVAGVVECQAPFNLCSVAGLSTGQNPIADTIVQTFPDLLSTLTVPDSLTGTFAVTTPVTGDFNLVATEVGSTFIASVPEPSPALLATAALTGLAFAGRRRAPAAG